MMADYCTYCGQWHPADTPCASLMTPRTVANVTPSLPDPTPALWEIAAQLRRIADALEAGK